MFSCVAGRDIAVAIEEAFDYVADLRNEVQWNPGARQITKLDDAPIRAGAAFSADYQGAGVLEIRVLEYERPHHLRYLSVGRALRLTSTIDCAESTTACCETPADVILPRQARVFGRLADSYGAHWE